jgi:hypothetical protein
MVIPEDFDDQPQGTNPQVSPQKPTSVRTVSNSRWYSAFSYGHLFLIALIIVVVVIYLDKWSSLHEASPALPRVQSVNPPVMEKQPLYTAKAKPIAISSLPVKSDLNTDEYPQRNLAPPSNRSSINQDVQELQQNEQELAVSKEIAALGLETHTKVVSDNHVIRPSYKMQLSSLGTSLQSGGRYRLDDPRFSEGSNLILSIEYEGTEPGRTELTVEWYVGNKPISVFPSLKVPARSGRWSRAYDNHKFEVGEYRIVLKVNGQEQPDYYSFWLDGNVVP